MNPVGSKRRQSPAATRVLMAPTVAHEQFLTTMKLRVRTLLINVKTLENFDQAQRERAAADEKEAAAASGSVSLVLRARAMLSGTVKMSSIARQDIIPSVVMRDVLKKVPGETDLKTVRRMYLTWLDTDILNIMPSHLFFLYATIYLHRAIMEAYPEKALVKETLQFANETLFALVPHVQQYRITEVVQMIGSMVPLEEMDDALRARIDESDQKVIQNLPLVLGSFVPIPGTDPQRRDG